MTINIPQGVFDKYKEGVDAMITHFGVKCLLYYPPQRQSSSIIEDPIGNKDANRNRAGGFSPFSFANSPHEGDSAYREDEPTEVITLRCYFTEKEWRNLGVSVHSSDGAAIVIGYITDMNKLERSTRIKLNSEMAGHGNMYYEMNGSPSPWGMQRDRYFVCELKRQ